MLPGAGTASLCLNASGLPWPGAQEGRDVAEERTQLWGQWVITAPDRVAGGRGRTTAVYSA